MKLAQKLQQLGIELPADVVSKLEPHVRVKGRLPKGDAKFVATGKELDGKIPTQMKQAISVLGEQPVTVGEWAAKLTKVDGFRTQQKPEKIVAFYRKRMIEEGYARAA